MTKPATDERLMDKRGPYVLVSHPFVGSAWLSNCKWKRDQDGHLLVYGYLPELVLWGGDQDYYEDWPYTFPASCVRKVVARG